MLRWRAKLKKLSEELRDNDSLEIGPEQRQQPIKLDEKELKKYLDFVIREVKKGDENKL